MTKKTVRIILFCAVVILCIGGVVWQLNHGTTATTIVTSHDYKNISYQIEGQSVALVNGVSNTAAAPGSASRIETRYFGNEATGDLNGDGKNDIAFLLTQTTGGTGTFYYVVAAIATGNGYSGTSAIWLGDRIAPQSTQIQNGTIIVNYADRKADEPMTASPSIGVSKYLKVSGAQLVVVQK